MPAHTQTCLRIVIPLISFVYTTYHPAISDIIIRSFPPGCPVFLCRLFSPIFKCVFYVQTHFCTKCLLSPCCGSSLSDSCTSWCLRLPSVFILQASPCVCLLHGLLGWPVSDVCLCSRTLYLSPSDLPVWLQWPPIRWKSTVTAMWFLYHAVLAKATEASVNCELLITFVVKKILWLIQLPHTGTLVHRIDLSTVDQLCR